MSLNYLKLIIICYYLITLYIICYFFFLLIIFLIFKLEFQFWFIIFDIFPLFIQLISIFIFKHSISQIIFHYTVSFDFSFLRTYELTEWLKINFILTYLSIETTAYHFHDLSVIIDAWIVESNVSYCAKVCVTDAKYWLRTLCWLKDTVIPGQNTKYLHLVWDHTCIYAFMEFNTFVTL